MAQESLTALVEGLGHSAIFAGRGAGNGDTGETETGFMGKIMALSGGMEGTNSLKYVCCFRHCRKKATELDFAPEFPLCSFHAEVISWYRLLDWIGALDPDKLPPPFLLPVKFYDAMASYCRSTKEKVRLKKLCGLHDRTQASCAVRASPCASAVGASHTGIP